MKIINKDNNLESLDLPTLIKLFIDNWESISNIYNLTSEERDVVFDMRKVRNRVAHLSKDKYKNFDDLFRDYDYIQRFLNLINIGQDNIKIFIDEIKKIKIDIMKEKLKLSIRDDIEPGEKVGMIKNNVAEIIFKPNKEEFVKNLIKKRKATYTIVYVDDTESEREWNANRFDESSDVIHNIRSGPLRDWKKKRIKKAIFRA